MSAAGLAGSQLVYVSTTECGGLATADIAVDASKYRGFLFLLHDLFPATDGDALWARYSINNGGAYIATAIYEWVRQALKTSGLRADTAAAADSKWVVGAVQDTALGNFLNGSILLTQGNNGPLGNRRPSLASDVMYVNNDAVPLYEASRGHGVLNAAIGSDLTNIRFLYSTGNFAANAGRIHLYGLI